MATLPRGITLVAYKNKDKSKVQKYRVRYRSAKNNFAADKLFDTQSDAEEFLAECKSHFGRKSIVEHDKLLSEMTEALTYPTFGKALDEYAKQKNPEPLDKSDYLRQKQYLTYDSFYRTIKTTKIKIVDESNLQLEFVRQLAIRNFPELMERTTTLGETKLLDVTTDHINAYIAARLAMGKKKTTVRKEFSIISCFYRDLISIRTLSRKLKEKVNNPCLNYDRSYFKDLRSDSLEPKRIEDSDYDKILSAIFYMPNHGRAKHSHEWAWIVLFSLYSACRRSEIINLKIGEIDLKRRVLKLTRTKTKKKRVVVINDDLLALLGIILEGRDMSDPNVKVFNMSISTFAKMYQRMQARFGFKDINMHTFRKESISRQIDAIGRGMPSILVAKTLGFTNVRQFEVDYMNSTPDLSTQAGVMANAGQSSPNITANHYYSFKNEDGKTSSPREGS